MPEPSDLITGTIGMLGRASPGLIRAIVGSLQDLILPVKMPAAVAASSRRFVIFAPEGLLRLYINAVPPATSGMY